MASNPAPYGSRSVPRAPPSATRRALRSERTWPRSWVVTEPNSLPFDPGTMRLPPEMQARGAAAIAEALEPKCSGLVEVRGATRRCTKRRVAGELLCSMHLRGASPRGGFVYLMSCGGFYKIGRAKSVDDRRAALQVANPLPVCVE